MTQDIQNRDKVNIEVKKGSSDTVTLPLLAYAYKTWERNASLHKEVRAVDNMNVIEKGCGLMINDGVSCVQVWCRWEVSLVWNGVTDENIIQEACDEETGKSVEKEGISVPN